MKNVLVLGAGKIGRMVASLLQGSGDYQVLVMDSHDAYIQETLALSPGATGTVGRFDDQAAVDKALDGQWAVVSCAPFFCNPMIAERAKAKGVHYLDLTEDVAVTKKVMELAKGAKTAFIPQCGLAPGFITIAANHVIHGMSDLQEVKMRVGALPEFPSNALKYNLTWSTDGLINEYIQPCEAVIDGKVTEVPALEGLEHMKIDGIDFEAFNTSGGLGTFALTLEGKVKLIQQMGGQFSESRMLLHVALLLADELGDLKIELVRNQHDESTPAPPPPTDPRLADPAHVAMREHFAATAPKRVTRSPNQRLGRHILSTMFAGTSKRM
jgi:saccharopine dehydrogenase-like NADP-dependent oxidoreductase